VQAARTAFISRKEKGGATAHHTPQVTPQVRRFAELAANAHFSLPLLLPFSPVCAPPAALPLPLPLRHR
jgi:hypothetical protein